MKFELNGEFIRLGDLLKAAGLTGTGGDTVHPAFRNTSCNAQNKQ